MTAHNILKLVGSKATMKDIVYRNLDYSKKCFLELFGGTGVISLDLPDCYKVIIYNDKDDDLVNFFMQVKNNYDNLIKALELPYARNISLEMRRKYENKDYKDDIERAVVTFYLMNSSWSGLIYKSGWSFSYIKNNAKSYHNKIKLLQKYYNRIKEIQLLNYDYKYILNSIKQNTEEDVMIYADPPYYGTENYYSGSFSKEDHIELAKLLNNLKSSIMISYYYFDGIEELYPKEKWNYYSYDRSLSSQKCTKAKRKKITELLILNYNPKPLLNKISGKEDIE